MHQRVSCAWNICMMQSARRYILKQDITGLGIGRNMNGGLEHDRPILHVCSCLDTVSLRIREHAVWAATF